MGQKGPEKDPMSALIAAVGVPVSFAWSFGRSLVVGAVFKPDDLYGSSIFLLGSGGRA